MSKEQRWPGRPRRLGDLAITSLIHQALAYAVGVGRSLYTALGLVIIAGAIVAFAGTWGFAELADTVQEGGAVQQIDEAVLLWIDEHRVPILHAFMIELTVLGSWVVITVVVGVAAVFLSIDHRRWSVLLLLVSSVGGVVITQLLKFGFDRERPQLFEWADHVVTASFPSGHSSGATIAYGTIAYLIARLHSHALTRWIILAIGSLVILGVGISRLYLGVHYPTDVIAGLLIGFAWAAFCMAALEAMQRFARLRAPELAERDVPNDRATGAAVHGETMHGAPPGASAPAGDIPEGRRSSGGGGHPEANRRPGG